MMKKFNKFLFLLTSLIALPLAGCSTTPESNDTELKKLVTEVHLDQDFITLEVGESIELQPIISFKDEQPHDDLKIKWITSDINVCSVDDGLVTALGGGEANVSIIAGYKMATCSIVVSTGGIAPVAITLSDTEKTITVGSQYQLSVTPSSGLEYTWATSDKEVVSVDQNGLVSAVGAGVADVGVSALGVSVSCRFTVIEDSDAFIRLNASKVDLPAGETYQLEAILKDSSVSVSWSSSDTSLATVSSSGLVTAKADAEGTVTITATAKGETATCVFDIVNEDDVYDVTVYFFVDYNNIDAEDTTGTKRLARFRWYNDRPLSESGKVPNNPTVALDPAFPYFIGWSDHTIIDSKDDLWVMNQDVTGNTPYIYLYGIWSDVPAGEFTK